MNNFQIELEEIKRRGDEEMLREKQIRKRASRLCRISKTKKIKSKLKAIYL